MNPNLQQLSGQVSQSMQQEVSLPDMLRSALVSKFSKDNPLMQQRQKAYENFISTPETAAHEFSQPRSVTVGGGQVPQPGQNPVGDQSTVQNVFFSPSEQRALISRRTAANLGPLMTLNDVIGNAYGGITNTVDSVTKALQAQTRQKESQYNMGLDQAKLNLEQQRINKSGASTSKEQMKLIRETLGAVSGIDNTIQKIRDARSAVESGGAGGLQAWDPLGLRSAGVLFPFSDKTVSVRSKLGEANTAWFDVAGKALTKNERELIKIAKETDDPRIIKQRLDDMERTLINKRASALLGGSFGSEESSGEGEWEVLY